MSIVWLRQIKVGGYAACMRARRQMRVAAASVRIVTTAAPRHRFPSAALPAAKQPLDKSHARSTSRFGEILWRTKDAARARNALDALGGDALTRAQTLGDGVLQRSKAQSSSKDGSQHGDLSRQSGVLISRACCSGSARMRSQKQHQPPPATTTPACSARLRSQELHYLLGATAPARAASGGWSRSTCTRCRARGAATWPTTSWPPMI